jgi:signal transduction histidine kinase
MGVLGGSEELELRSIGRQSPVALTVAGWAVGLAVTASILGTPYLVFGYRSPSMHLVLDTVDGCVAALVGYLVLGRFLRTHRLQDLLLAQGLLVLAFAGLGIVLALQELGGLGTGTLQVWLPLTLRFVGAALIAVAALAGARTAGPRARRWGRSAPWVFIVLVTGVLWVMRDRLPAAIEVPPPATAEHPVIAGSPALLATHAATALCFVVASLVLAAQATRTRDELLRWVGPAFALAAFARVNYVLFPSLYTDWVYTGDLLRTGCYVLLLVGAAREISEYWAAQADAAVLEDRRRLARELHDGVVQELGLIRGEAHAVPGDARDTIVAACDRALDEARAAVDALGRSVDEPLGLTLHRAARQVVERYDGQLEVELDDTVTAAPDQRHALVRITREAVSNALRHGRAGRVVLRVLRDQDRRRLVVEDDGRGFDVPSAARSIGFGLTSMSERARALPGAFRVESAPGRGTVVEVTW